MWELLFFVCLSLPVGVFWRLVCFLSFLAPRYFDVSALCLESYEDFFQLFISYGCLNFPSLYELNELDFYLIGKFGFNHL